MPVRRLVSGIRYDLVQGQLEQLDAVGDYECPAGMSVELESSLRFEHQGIEKAFDCTYLGASCC
jgi:hypothetical protein